MLRALLIFITAAALAQEPAPGLDATQIMTRLDWIPTSLAEFEKLIEQAHKAEINELDLLIPRVEASLIFGDIEKLRPAYKAAVAAKSKILARKANDSGGVAHTLKIAKRLLDFAEKRPGEVEKRTTLFRNLVLAYQTREDLELLANAITTYTGDKKPEPGTPIMWSDIRPLLDAKKQLTETGATILGDKIGPLKAGEPPLLPKPTWEKLKDFVPADYWGDHAPYAKEEARP